MDLISGKECPLWHFSLAVYSQPTVAENCIRLQEEYRLDVNIVLALLYLSNRRLGIPTAQTVAKLIQVSSPWQGYAALVRSLRRRLKTVVDKGEYQQIKLAELNYEYLEQQRLYQAIDAMALESSAEPSLQPHQTADECLTLYCQTLDGCHCDEQFHRLIANLLCALWPDNRDDITCCHK